jgi:hypothetical protein
LSPTPAEVFAARNDKLKHIGHRKRDSEIFMTTSLELAQALDLFSVAPKDGGDFNALCFSRCPSVSLTNTSATNNADVNHSD